MTGASVNFKAVKSAGHSVSHASREVAPTYLLPIDKSYGTMVLLDEKGKVSQVLDAKMALASPRAKVDQRYSPVWEGILNLRRPEPGEDANSYRAECGAVVTDWYKQYETATGHKVLRVDVHLDEGHMVEGEAVLNAHAHVIADRTNDLGRVIKLSPKQLRELQTMTAEITQLERGKSSFETGRKHIGHQAYKHLAEQGRLETQQVKVKLDKSQSDLERQRKLSMEWSDADLAKVKNLQIKLDGEPARLAAALKAQEAQLNEQYRSDREALKASGEAEQADYQALKKAHEELLATLKKPKKEKKNDTRQHPKFAQEPTGILEMQDVFGCDNVHDLQHFEDLLQQDAPGHLRPVQTPADHPELQQLDPPGRLQVDLLQEALADNVALKKTHEKALADLTKAQTEAGKVSGLEVQIDQLIPQAAKVPGLEKQVTDARQDTSNKAAEIARINTQHQLDREALETKYKDDRAEYKASAEKKTQKDYSDLKTAHLGELAAQAKTHAAELATLKTKLAKVPELEATVTLKTAEIDRLTPLAALVPDLKTELARAAQQAAKVPSLEAQITQLTPLAEQVPDLKKGLAEALTQGEKLAVSEEKLGKLEVRHEAFKVKANEKIAGILTEANEKLGALRVDLAAANKLVEVEQAKERIKTPQEQPKAVVDGIPSPSPSKTPREGFLELYGHIKTVLVGLIDGMRLDAMEGRLGLFSSHSRTGPRVQVLCEVPENKVMPALGQVFNQRAVPGQSKNGIGG